ncbi:MAG: hypothetical protein JW884_13295 [Deltaproteobacteria bacterium]|nr:hypothetical protein [Deltaproteobacteria bacterium]
MTDKIYITLAVEDLLSEAILRSILRQSERPYHVLSCIGLTGFGYLRLNIKKLNQAARKTPILVLTDLDRTECAPILLREWLNVSPHKNLIFRVAVREVESWIMAHRKAFAAFLGIGINLVPTNPDELADPKRTLLDLAARSRKRELREAIVPAPKSTAKVGPDYNGRLGEFVMMNWDVCEAAQNSLSLGKAFRAIASFDPTQEGVPCPR